MDLSPAYHPQSPVMRLARFREALLVSELRAASWSRWINDDVERFNRLEASATTREARSAIQFLRSRIDAHLYSYRGAVRDASERLEQFDALRAELDLPPLETPLAAMQRIRKTLLQQQEEFGIDTSEEVARLNAEMEIF